MKRFRFLTLLLLLLVLITSCGSPQPAKNSVNGFYFDTVVTITAYAPLELLQGALDVCDAYEKLLSKTAAQSDVSKINQAGGAPVDVSTDTIAVLQAAQEISALSDGAFDITIAPAVNVWDFSGESAALPDADTIAAAVRLVDYRKVELNGTTVTLPAGMQIDLGGIAKGYIADAVANYLKQHGVASAILNFGGNVLTIGKKPDGSLWHVGVQDPNAPSGAYLTSVSVGSAAVVTSGTYERGFTKNGVRFHHILDPKTGWPVQNGLTSVTILADSSLYADALSTACFVLGEADGMRLINGMEHTEAAFLYEDGRMVCSDGFYTAFEESE